MLLYNESKVSKVQECIILLKKLKPMKLKAKILKLTEIRRNYHLILLNIAVTQLPGCQRHFCYDFCIKLC